MIEAENNNKPYNHNDYECELWFQDAHTKNWFCYDSYLCKSEALMERSRMHEEDVKNQIGGYLVKEIESKSTVSEV